MVPASARSYCRAANASRSASAPSPSADCTVPVSDNNVSRRHCEIRPLGTGYIVTDLGSTNGTKVNGLRIEGDHPLSDADIVSVGSTHLRFEAS